MKSKPGENVLHYNVKIVALTPSPLYLYKCIFTYGQVWLSWLDSVCWIERRSLPSKNFPRISMDMLQIGALVLLGRLVEAVRPWFLSYYTVKNRTLYQVDISMSHVSNSWQLFRERRNITFLLIQCDISTFHKQFPTIWTIGHRYIYSIQHSIFRVYSENWPYSL